MELTKDIENCIITRGDYIVKNRKKTTIKEDSRILSSFFSDTVYNPDSDWSTGSTMIKTICGIHFTNTIKSAWAELDNSEKNEYKKG